MEVVSSSAPLAKEDNSIESSGKMPVRSRKRRNICIGVSITVIGLVILVVILAFTVFKPKPAVITVNSVDLVDLNVSLDIARLGVSLNITLRVDLSVKNPNKVDFKYTDSTALVNYRGELVGEASIPAGQISADQTKHMNITLTIMAARLLTRSELFSDVVAGALPVNTYTRVSGKATVLAVFKVRVVSTSSCDLTINIANRSIGDQQCKYQAKI